MGKAGSMAIPHPAMTLSRRHFLRTAALATLAFPAVVRARNLNSKIQIAAVGVDGKGYSDIDECA